MDKIKSVFSYFNDDRSNSQNNTNSSNKHTPRHSRDYSVDETFKDIKYRLNNLSAMKMDFMNKKRKNDTRDSSLCRCDKKTYNLSQSSLLLIEREDDKKKDAFSERSIKGNYTEKREDHELLGDMVKSRAHVPENMAYNSDKEDDHRNMLRNKNKEAPNSNDMLNSTLDNTEFSNANNSYNNLNINNLDESTDNCFKIILKNRFVNSSSPRKLSEDYSKSNHKIEENKDNHSKKSNSPINDNISNKSLQNSSNNDKYSSKSDKINKISDNFGSQEKLFNEFTDNDREQDIRTLNQLSKLKNTFVEPEHVVVDDFVLEEVIGNPEDTINFEAVDDTGNNGADDKGIEEGDSSSINDNNSGILDNDNKFSIPEAKEEDNTLDCDIKSIIAVKIFKAITPTTSKVNNKNTNKKRLNKDSNYNSHDFVVFLQYLSTIYFYWTSESQHICKINYKMHEEQDITDISKNNNSKQVFSDYIIKLDFKKHTCLFKKPIALNKHYDSWLAKNTAIPEDVSDLININSSIFSVETIDEEIKDFFLKKRNNGKDGDEVDSKGSRSRVSQVCSWSNLSKKNSFWVYCSVDPTKK